MDEQVRFVFVTGVSMFSKGSLFSGLNNLEDISLDPRYGTIAATPKTISIACSHPSFRDWTGMRYGSGTTATTGLATSGSTTLSVCCCCSTPVSSNPTGSRQALRPFVFEKMREASITPMDLENRMTDIELVSKFDVEDIEVEALMFQTGYLTIAEELGDEDDDLFRLDYPNFEVRRSLNRGLLEHVGKRSFAAIGAARGLHECLEANDFGGFADRLRVYLSGIPHQWHASADLARYEAWYASQLYMCFGQLTWMSGSRSHRATVGRTFSSSAADRCLFSSSKWWTGRTLLRRRWMRQSPRCVNGDMPRSTATVANRST